MLTKEAEEVLIQHVPEGVKDAIQNFQMHKLAEQVTGLSAGTLDFAKAAEYLSHRMAYRQARWKGIGDGLTALKQLSEDR